MNKNSITPSSWLVVFKEIMCIRLSKYNDFSLTLLPNPLLFDSWFIDPLIVSILDVQLHFKACNSETLYITENKILNL